MVADEFLKGAIFEFRNLKKLGDRALIQLSDQDFFVAPDSESNSIALIIKHLAGNMHSRWTDFLTTDGEKTDRNRDQEFELTKEMSREKVMQLWEQGWQILFAAIEPLQPEDVTRIVLIRGEPHTVMQAIHRQLTHYASHLGQIVFWAKHLAGNNWNSLSIPRRQSAQFNESIKTDPQAYSYNKNNLEV